MVIYHNSAKDSNNKPRWNRIETAQKIIDFNKISKNTAIYAIFFTLRLAVLAATPLRKLLQNKDVLQPCGCLSPNTWMESLSLREDLPPTPCQIRKNRPGIPGEISEMIMRFLCEKIE